MEWPSPIRFIDSWLSAPVLGISLLSDSLQTAAVRREKSGLRVLGCCTEKIPRLSSGRPVDTSVAVAQALQRARSRLPGKASAAALAIPATMMFRHHVNIDRAMDPLQRETALLAETECLLPYPADSLLMDYRDEDGAGRYEVTVCRRSEMQPWHDGIRKAGLRLQRIEPLADAKHRARQRFHDPLPSEWWGCCGTAAGICRGLSRGTAGVNLLPWRLQQHRNRSRMLMSLAAGAGLLGLATAYALSLDATEQRRQQTTLLERQQLQIAEVKQRLGRLREAAQRDTLLVQRIDHMRRWHGSRRNLAALIEQLPQAIPTGLRLISMQLRDSILQLQGETAELGRVAELLHNLDQSGLLHSLSLIEARRLPETGLQRFSLRGQLADEATP